MDVEIGDVVTEVTAVDGSTLLSPEALRQIVRVVLHALDEREKHRVRVRTERRITGGVALERDTEE